MRWLTAASCGQGNYHRCAVTLGAMGSGVAGGEGAIYLWAKLPVGNKISLCWAVKKLEYE